MYLEKQTSSGNGKANNPPIDPEISNDSRQMASNSQSNRPIEVDPQFINQYMTKPVQEEPELDIMEFENDVVVDMTPKLQPYMISSRTPIDLGTKKIQLVEYNFDQKTQRLGRPRNHSLSHIKSTSHDSSQNEIESKYMRYRLDNKPVEGPGSRGGKVDAKAQKGKITGETLRKKKQAQSQLVFDSHSIKLKNSPPKVQVKPIADLKSEVDKFRTEFQATEFRNEFKPTEFNNTYKPVEFNTDFKPVESKFLEFKSSSPPAKKQKKDKSEVPRKDSEFTIINVSSKEPSEENRKKPEERKKKEPPLSSFSKASRTTVLNGRNKVTRQFPGPLIPLFYDLYDENLMNSVKNKDVVKEKLAFGFKAKKVEYGEDILFLVSYISQFSDIIGLGLIGPQDIEDGIGLGTDDETEVSSLMNSLFARLSTLVLNRKTDVNPKHQGKPAAELKAVCFGLGLPKEWRDNNEVFEKVPLDKEMLEPIDESNNEILIDEWYKYKPPLIVDSPFNDKQGFEKIGFPGISNPLDRLIMLRTLAQWTLTASNDIKNVISETISKQDIPGDKETFYASRAILKGMKHAEDLTVETNNKIQKKNYREDNEMVAKYIEPSSNPLDHCLRLRFDDMVVGDLGYNIGRFYLVRMADEKSGGLSSVKKMQKTWTNYDLQAVNSSRFKLYVQDVHKMLVEQLNSEGVEFDTEGNEITSKLVPSSHIYEIASNPKELESFINHLNQKMPEISPSSNIYRPFISFHEYLTGILGLLKYQDNAKVEARASRKKHIDYSAHTPKEDEEEEEEEEEVVVQDDEEDDDYEE